jgi:hypothetical protein
MLGPLPKQTHFPGWTNIPYFTEEQVRAYGGQERAAERERWATAARLVVEATPEQLPMALDALADVLRA